LGPIPNPQSPIPNPQSPIILRKKLFNLNVIIKKTEKIIKILKYQ